MLIEDKPHESKNTLDPEPLESGIGDVVDIDVNGILGVEDISAKQLLVAPDRVKHADSGRQNQGGKKVGGRYRLCGVHDQV